MRAEQGQRGGEYCYMADEEVVLHARGGSLPATEHLLGKYRSLVEGKARAYYVAGAERDDVIQEGMIGLFKAIRDFSSDQLSAFKTFAELCITRQIITAIKTATRQKHRLLNTYIPLDTPIGSEDEHRTLADTICEYPSEGPEELLLRREFQGRALRLMRQGLSRLEGKVLMLYIDGKSYEEIGKELGCSVKQVDNALQRAKKKMARKLQLKHAPT